MSDRGCPRLPGRRGSLTRLSPETGCGDCRRRHLPRQIVRMSDRDLPEEPPGMPPAFVPGSYPAFWKVHDNDLARYRSSHSRSHVQASPCRFHCPNVRSNLSKLCQGLYPIFRSNASKPSPNLDRLPAIRTAALRQRPRAVRLRVPERTSWLCPSKEKTP